MKKFPYKYLDYEIELMYREIKTFFPEANIDETKKGIAIANINKEHYPLLERLTYIERFEYEGQSEYTLQAKLESTASGTHNKQQTRYSSNGLHEYKGKFNPQIVRGLLNVLGINEGMNVVDPFCGSGTTLLE